jgi:hypothetical protein
VLSSVLTARRSLLVAPLVAILAACGDSSRVSAPRTLAPAAAAADVDAARDPEIPIYSLGTLRRATPQSPCHSGAYRQFDFWLGEWQVRGPAGAVVAGSRIASDLDGCVITERWMPLARAGGRSLSSYDPSIGQWRQTWVPEQGPGSRPLRLVGSLGDDGVMRMSGTRHHWFYGFPYFDAYTWTPVDADHVIQTATADIPALNIHSAGAFNYERTRTLPSSHSPGSTACQPGGDAAETRMLDFTVGHWAVQAANGLRLGASDIVVDPTSSGCLIEETFATPKGYRAISWLYYDPIENRFFRTYVDTEGARLELSGEPTINPLVMEGVLSTPGEANARVRLTWTSISATELRQAWSISRDEGATWHDALQLGLVRQ